MTWKTALAHEFLSTRQQLTDWFMQDALPFWSTAGTDWSRGGFFERFDADTGVVVEAPRRTRVAARQIHVFAKAMQLGWSGPAHRCMVHGVDFLLSRLRLPDGTFAASAQADGSATDAGFDLYEQAFALFGMAMAKASDPGIVGLDAAALELLRQLRSRWSHPEAGFEESMPPSLPLRANPHMHLLEAAIAWCDVDPREEWRLLAEELVSLATSRFIDPLTGALKEFFDAQWQPMPGRMGAIVEPGHQFEWAWLLLEWDKRRGRPDLVPVARQLMALAEAHGISPMGFAVNELHEVLSVSDARARLWPQTERIKAWTAMVRLAASPLHVDRAIGKAIEAAQALLRYLRTPHRGLWHETFDPAGFFLKEDCRASSLYHIVGAIESLHGIEVAAP